MEQVSTHTPWNDDPHGNKPSPYVWNHGEYKGVESCIQKMIKKIRANDEKRYNTKLQEELTEQKEQIYKEIYTPGGIGYQAAKERFESQ